MERFSNKIMPECRHTIRNFSGQGKVLWNEDTLINISSETQGKKLPQGNILEVFLLYTVYYILNGKFSPKMNTIKVFFPKAENSFRIFKKRQEQPPPLHSSCAPLRLAKYASVSLNIPKYPWKCFNRLFWLCQHSEYVWSSEMFDWLLKTPWVLNVSEFWVWHGCICKGYTVFWIYLYNMPEYNVLTISRFSICVIILYIWQSFKYASGIKYPRVLNVLWYSCNNTIIILSNAITLEFLSAWFINPGRFFSKHFYCHYSVKKTNSSTEFQDSIFHLVFFNNSYCNFWSSISNILPTIELQRRINFQCFLL